MSAVRLRRLQADYQKLQAYVTRHPRVQLIQTDGDPPERYQLQYQIRSLRQKDDGLVEATTHLVEIALPRNYPRTPPQCRMLTPIFHPNIAPHAICIGDHWSAGEPLASIVARIGELIAYQSYNTKSPLNGEAARWTSEHEEQLPLDPVNMLVEDATPTSTPDVTSAPSLQTSPPTPPPTPPTPPEPPPIEDRSMIHCPQCSAQLRVAARYRGKQVSCPRCHRVMRVPAEASHS
jgi:ubiquitin-protein ligase